MTAHGKKSDDSSQSADASRARDKNDLPVLIARSLEQSLRNPLRAPKLIKGVFETIITSVRAHYGARRKLSTFTSSATTVDLDLHARALSRCLDRDAALRFIELTERGAVDDALELLSSCVARQKSVPEPLLHLVQKANVSMRWLTSGYPLPGHKLPTSKPHLAPRNVLFVFHSRSPLVNNGYAARSLETIGAVGAHGWRAQAVTRLGFPHDINRYQSSFVPEREDYGGVPCHQLNDPQDGQRGRAPDDYIDAYAQRLEQKIEQTQSTIIHAASNYLNGIAAAQAARTTGRAMVYEVRGLWELTALSRGDYSRDDARFCLAQKMETQAANAADAVIALSSGLKRELVARGVDAEKIYIAPNCVDLDLYGNQSADIALAQSLGLDADIIVGYFGAFVDYEGLETLLDALAILKSRGASVQALLIGGGASEARLKERATNLQLGPTVRFLDKVPREKLEQYASLCSAVAIPRRSTPVTQIVPPIKAVEAMARGQALVVSDVEALRDLVRDGETGLVVKPEDPTAWANALETLACQRDFTLALGTAARESARQRFDKKIVGEILIRAYEEAVRRNATNLATRFARDTEITQRPKRI